MIKRFLFLFFFINYSIFIAQNNVYKDGEYLSYKVKYGWFSASKASIQLKEEKYNGENTYHIVGYGQTTGLLDVFFKVRDRYETYIDKKKVKPYKFIRDLSEGGYIKNKMILFDHKTNVATVHDYKYNKTYTQKFSDGTQDMLSALYYLRNIVDNDNLSLGQEFKLNIFFDEENYDFKAKFLGREILKTKYGKKRTLKFRPYVKSGRVFKEEESVTIWISDDKNKIPLQIEAQLAVGSLTAKLNEHKNLKYPF